METNQKYLTNDFMNQLYHKIQPDKDLLTCREEEISVIRSEGVRKLCSILKLEEIEHMFGNGLAYEPDGDMTSMGIQIDKYQVHAIKGLDFPIYHLKPEKSNGKTILYLHGHDDLGILGALLERTDKVRYHKMIPVKLAKEGYDVVAPEMIGLGESRFQGLNKGKEVLYGCVINEGFLELAGFSICGFRVFQSIKTLDFIEKIGLGNDIIAFGVSGGGMICQHVSVLEDRIKKVLIASYSNTYIDSVLAKEQCADNYVPGLLQIGDSYQLLSLAAPKPMLTVNGTADRAFPEAGSRVAFDYLEKVYARLGASDQYEWKLFDGKHEVNEEIIIDWLKRNA